MDSLYIHILVPLYLLEQGQEAFRLHLVYAISGYRAFTHTRVAPGQAVLSIIVEVMTVPDVIE